MTFDLVKKLLNHYIEKNHSDADFYNNKEFKKLSSLHGMKYRNYIKKKFFCIYEKIIQEHRDRFLATHSYNYNWINENEEEEESTTREPAPDEVTVNPPVEEKVQPVEDTNDMSKPPRKRRILKENMFNDAEGGKAAKVFKCELPGCNRQYTSSFGLKYHMKEGHSEEKLNVYKPFVCPMNLCGRKYKNNNGLKYHLKNYHDIE